MSLVALATCAVPSALKVMQPDVASSDATNIRARIERSGDEYVVNGRKWWSTGAGDPRCEIAIVMGKTDPEAPRHEQQSMILVPLDAPGVEIERTLPVFGYDEDRKSTRLNSSHANISYAVFCLKKKHT